jgi:hypothetical protein
MRAQRRAAVTVTLTRPAGKDKYGDAVEPAGSPVEIQRAIFQPASMLERTSDDQAPVLQVAAWDLPGVHDVRAGDLITHGADVWQAEGGGTVWLDRTKVPVTQARAS